MLKQSQNQERTQNGTASLKQVKPNKIHSGLQVKQKETQVKVSVNKKFNLAESKQIFSFGIKVPKSWGRVKKHPQSLKWEVFPASDDLGCHNLLMLVGEILQSLESGFKSISCCLLLKAVWTCWLVFLQDLVPKVPKANSMVWLCVCVELIEIKLCRFKHALINL